LIFRTVASSDNVIATVCASLFTALFIYVCQYDFFELSNYCVIQFCDPLHKYRTGEARNFKVGIRIHLGKSHLTDEKYPHREREKYPHRGRGKGPGPNF